METFKPIDLDEYEIIKEIHETYTNGNQATYHIMKKKKDWFGIIQKASSIMGIFLISVSVGYYFLFRPIQNERRNAEREKQLSECLDKAGNGVGKFSDTARAVCAQRFK